MTLRTAFLSIALISAAYLEPATAIAQNMGDTVKMIVPGQVGSHADTVARIWENVLDDQNTYDTLVENRPDAGGIISLTTLYETQNPNFELLVSYGSVLSQNAIRLGEVGVDVSGFTPVCQLANATPFIWVLDDANGLAVEDLKNSYDAKIGAVGTHGGALARNLTSGFLSGSSAIQYQDWSSGFAALLSGESDAFVSYPSPMKEAYASGTAQPIISLAPSSSSAFENVPSVLDHGSEFVFANELTVWASPSATPGAIALHEANCRVVAESEAFKKFSEERMLERLYFSGSDLSPVLSPGGGSCSKCCNSTKKTCCSSCSAVWE